MKAESNAMSSSDPAQPTSSAPYRPLRIWIPVVLLVLMVVARYFMTWFPEIPMVWIVGAFVPFLLSLVVIGWWLTLSRATWTERGVGLLGVGLILVAVVAAMDATMRGAPIFVLTVPTTMAAFALALIVQGGVLGFRRTGISLLFAAVVASGSAMLKNDGATGGFSFGFSWRWQPTPEEEFLAQRPTNPRATRRPTTASFQQPAWPGFRGPDRDGKQTGQVFSADWKSQPPHEIWRIKLGPAWSSFAVADQFLVTSSKEVWTTRNLKPDFNDFVTHQGFAYGFDGAVFACVDLQDGRRAWKQGRYGKGQVLLLADSNLLLVIAEESGELVLLEANPEELVERGTITALDGKTWNHPVVIGKRLYLRNAKEAVCYELP